MLIIAGTSAREPRNSFKNITIFSFRKNKESTNQHKMIKSQHKKIKW